MILIKLYVCQFVPINKNKFCKSLNISIPTLLRTKMYLLHCFHVHWHAYANADYKLFTNITLIIVSVV